MPPQPGAGSSSSGTVSAVVLAAGEARRYGELKQLLDWNGQPFVRVVTNTALEAGLSPVVVVTGAQPDRVCRAVEDLPVIVVHNLDWAEGQSTSVKTGLQALPAQCPASIFLLADQPQIPAGLLRSLVEAHTRTGFPVIAPQVNGNPTSPVLFDRSLFPELESLTGDTGGRALFGRYPPHLMPWGDDVIGMDVDNPSDYQDLLRYNSSEQG